VAGSLCKILRSQRPLIHEAETTSAGLSWAALQWLEDHVEPGMRTLETGAGLSTIIFAAGGSEHIAITPVAEEELAVRRVCASLTVDASNVRFMIGPSETLLPSLPSSAALDLALIDGAHGFPYAILDWWYLAARLRIGGAMLLDDAYLPTVLAIVDGLRGVDSWHVDAPISDRTVLIRKLGDELPPDVWPGGALGGRESFRYLPLPHRLRAAAKHRIFSTAVGKRVVALRHDARRRTRIVK
jgi:predicted O-methyltransferase YrrM